MTHKKILCSAITLALVSLAHAAPEYSPHVGQTFPNRVLFGDTHLHTSYSLDAAALGDNLGPEAAYRFALGEEVTASTGVKAKLARPLDFLVVADHAENLGLMPLLAEGNPALMNSDFGKQMYELLKSGRGQDAFALWRKTRRDTGKDPAAGLGIEQIAWQRITAAAEKYNRPGSFTALIGYEWSSVSDGRNLHRNVIFRDGKDKADQIVPLSQYDTIDPEGLWAWMGEYEKKTGGKLLAIPHNGNLSSGLMFDDITLTDKKPLSKDYAERRMRWEPIYEVTQMKGTGEAHPSFSPGDEFANYELLDKSALSNNEVQTPSMLQRSYAREAFKRGLVYEAKLGANPFKFGLIGSTDSHTTLSTSEENNNFGKISGMEPSAKPERFNELLTGRPEMGGVGTKVAQYLWQTSASGLAAVWARENTREAIWDAMARKEVYATTGTRLEVRVFGGFDFKAADLTRADFVANGYAKGVPMGGNLGGDLRQVGAGNTAPSFLVRAARSPDGANLDRVQMVKGWLDAKGMTQEKVYDIAWSGNRKPGKNGKLPPVGNTVNVKEATYNNSIGAPVLEAYWKDPTFKADEKAFYYVRVLEIPTPRWTTYDAKIFGVDLPKGAPASIQDRAYTTPVWYSPS